MIEVVGIYVLLTALIGVYGVTKKSDFTYWINESKFNTFITTICLCATQLGAGAILGTTASAYDTGIGYPIITATTGVLGFFLLGKAATYFYPLSKEGIFTPAGFIGKFYGRWPQILAGLISVFVYVNLTAAQLTALSEIVRFIAPSYHLLIYGTLVVVMAAYMAVGGARGDLRTDVLHFGALSGIILTVLAIVVYNNINVLSAVNSVYFNPFHFGGAPIFLFGIILGGLFPLVSVELWQRLYAGKDVNVAKISAWIAIPIICSIYLVCALIGLEMIALHKNVDKNAVFFLFLTSNTSEVISSVTIAAIVGAVLSATNGMVLGVSSIICVDIANIGKERSYISISIVVAITVLCSLIAFIFNDIVQLVLNASFLLLIVAVPIAFVMINRPLTHVGAVASLALGALSTLLSLPLLGKSAFLPGIGLSIVSAMIDRLITARR